jgi:hypothetical protein
MFICTYDGCRMSDVQCRMSSGGGRFRGLKEPDPLPTAQANELCLSDSKSFIFSLATSKTVQKYGLCGVLAP